METAGRSNIHIDLKLLVETVDLLDAIALIDQNIKLVDYSRKFPISNVDLSDRDYFKEISQNHAKDIWVGPSQNRSSGAWTTSHAIRISTAQDDFAGIVLALMSVRQVEQKFASVALQYDSVML